MTPPEPAPGLQQRIPVPAQDRVFKRGNQIPCVIPFLQG